jgi:hypothetical protein
MASSVLSSPGLDVAWRRNRSILLRGSCSPKKEQVVKTIIIAVSAAMLVAATPTALAKSTSAATPAQQHKISARHHSAPVGRPSARDMQGARLRATYPNAYGYAPSPPYGYVPSPHFDYMPSPHVDPEALAAKIGGG